jgi:F0F1-type ATP synthase epsilon subunit
MSPFPLLTLRILSPDGINIERTGLYEVSVPLADGGSIGIKPGHAPLIAETVQGAVKFRSESGKNSIDLLPGVLDIRDNTVIILSAGEIMQDANFAGEKTPIKLERIMQTLVNKLEPKDASRKSQNWHG